VGVFTGEKHGAESRKGHRRDVIISVDFSPPSYRIMLTIGPMLRAHTVSLRGAGSRSKKTAIRIKTVQ
jgi:hypothetical protein